MILENQRIAMSQSNYYHIAAGCGQSRVFELVKQRYKKSIVLHQMTKAHGTQLKIKLSSPGRQIFLPYSMIKIIHLQSLASHDNKLMRGKTHNSYMHYMHIPSPGSAHAKPTGFIKRIQLFFTAVNPPLKQGKKITFSHEDGTRASKIHWKISSRSDDMTTKPLMPRSRSFN
jgi:hypothetical protein